MDFLFVDSVAFLRRSERISGVLALPADLPLFGVHFPSDPIFPASLTIESFAQAGTILLETGHDFTRKALVAFIRSAKFHRAIRPPDALNLDVTVDQWSDDGALLDCRASQRGVECASCRLGMVTAPIGSYYGGASVELYRRLYEGWLAHAILEGFETHPLEALRRGRTD